MSMIPITPQLPQMLLLCSGNTIAYYKTDGYLPGVIFIHGLFSDMSSEKAVFLERWCSRKKRAFVRFDCFGHGLSSGNFCDGTIGHWVDDTISVLEILAQGPQVLVGSSIGGWIALLVAQQRPELVAGIIGLSAAVDFTEDIIWQQLSPSQREEVMYRGTTTLQNTYSNTPRSISKALIEDGRRHLLLRQAIAVHCPVRLVHSLSDLDVPWKTALQIQALITNSDVIVTLVKDGDHRLSRPEDLERLIKAIVELITILTGRTNAL